MKYLQLTFLSFLLFCATGMAQQKTSGKAVISTPGLYTEECKAKIAFYVCKTQAKRARNGQPN